MTTVLRTSFGEFEIEDVTDLRFYLPFVFEREDRAVPPVAETFFNPHCECRELTLEAEGETHVLHALWNGERAMAVLLPTGDGASFHTEDPSAADVEHRFLLDNGQEDVYPARFTVTAEVFGFALTGALFGSRALPHGVDWVED